MRTRSKRPALLWAIAATLFASSAIAAPTDHTIPRFGDRFQPDRLTVPAGKKIELVIKNAGSAVAEFESYDLNREKVIPGQTSTTLYIGPLQPGTYRFFDDFHRQTSGQIIAK